MDADVQETRHGDVPGLRIFTRLRDEGGSVGLEVFYERNDRCGFDRMVDRVSLTEVEHRDKVDDRVREMGNRWTGP
ncbi:hypothetical protein [Natronosalvus caseinilyticus]|uniref:hypothetical protein n=1 Tax=Natronosalvus caseinilyticus TaxID=2953747 RepID=UPI0028B0AE54|nr:hypothetical protein [Natronosalvus caseinilyticus]